MRLLITGMTSSLGEQTIYEFAKMGYDIVGLYHLEETLAMQIKTKVETKYQVKMDIYGADLRINEDIKRIYEVLAHDNKMIDVLINNASVSHDGPFDEKTKEEFMDTLEVNLGGTFLVTKYISKLMTRGCILNIASSDGVDTYNELNFDYALSKAGIINFSKSLALIFPYLKIYTISPNWIDTKAIRAINKDYLKQELLRTGQSRLLNATEISEFLFKLINSQELSGCNFRLDVKNNQVEVKKYE